VGYLNHKQVDKIVYKDESYDIIGSCMEVHKELGPGFLELVYHEALALELDLKHIPHVQEKELKITYKGVHLQKHYFADFVCYDDIILEIKAVNELSSVHVSQILNYLKATNMKLGILVNFGGKSLEYKRIVR
jgi:GxxExxY protein